MRHETTNRPEDLIYLWLAGVVVFLDMFRYLNALEMGKIKSTMREQLAEATVDVEPVWRETDEATPVTYSGESPEVDVHGDFRDRFTIFVRVRDFLLRHRVRAHVFSGIEYMMFVFIVGPLIDRIVVTTVLASLLFAAFEVLLIYKLWTTTKTFGRRLTRLRAATTEHGPAVPTPAAATRTLATS